MAKEIKKFVQHSTNEKKEYAKKFSNAELNAYRKGQTQGFLNGVHASKKVK